jgi:ABC-type polar amino acid transport system ATPase subunit
MTMLVVTHELDFARKVADRVLMFDHGIIIEEGAPEAFFTQAKEERTRRFLSQITWDEPALSPVEPERQKQGEKRI